MKERERILVGGWALDLVALQGQFKPGRHAAPPTQRDIGVALFALDFEDDFFQHNGNAQKFLPIGAVKTKSRSEPRAFILFFSSSD